MKILFGTVMQLGTERGNPCSSSQLTDCSGSPPPNYTMRGTNYPASPDSVTNQPLESSDLFSLVTIHKEFSTECAIKDLSLYNMNKMLKRLC